MDMRTWAVLLAAGQGNRLRAVLPGVSKQFLLLDGLPLFWRSALNLAAAPRVCGMVLVLPQHDFDTSRELAERCNTASPLGIPLLMTPGGELRQDSVRNALGVLPLECTHVLVHDSARPFVSPALIRTILDGLREKLPGVIPGLEPGDTIKEVDDQGMAVRTPDRSRLRCVQTPQGFERQALYDAHERCGRQGWKVTDDAALLELCGVPVKVVPGEAANKKITTPEDLALLETAGRTERPGSFFKDERMKNVMLPCVGFGYDVHAYGGGKPFIIGGVRIESTELTLTAHSDGDVLLHALIDALLGCVGAGDIGTLFPDTDRKFENISSAILLSETLELVRKSGLVLTHVDLTVVAQMPKIGPFRKEIARNVAHLLQLEETRVNVKATTEEGLGFTGAVQGIKAMAAVTGLRPE